MEIVDLTRVEVEFTHRRGAKLRRAVWPLCDGNVRAGGSDRPYLSLIQNVLHLQARRITVSGKRAEVVAGRGSNSLLQFQTYSSPVRPSATTTLPHRRHNRRGMLGKWRAFDRVVVQKRQGQPFFTLPARALESNAGANSFLLHHHTKWNGGRKQPGAGYEGRAIHSARREPEFATNHTAQCLHWHMLPPFLKRGLLPTVPYYVECHSGDRRLGA